MVKIVLFLLLVLFLHKLRTIGRLIFLHIASKTGNQTRNQGDNAQQDSLTLENISGLELLACDQHIETCGGLQRRTPRDIEEMATVWMGTLAVTFGDIQGDAGAGSIELISR